MAQDTQVILDLATTTTPGGWVSQSYTEGLTSTLMANGLIGRVTIKPHTRQARTVLDYMRGLLGADLQLEPPTDPLQGSIPAGTSEEYHDKGQPEQQFETA